MGSFLIDLGNSNDGPIGMVLRVKAANENKAVQIARKAISLVTGDCDEIAVSVPTEVKDAVEYMNIYLNPTQSRRRMSVNERITFDVLEEAQE